MELASFESAGSARPGVLVKLRPSRPWRIGPASGEPGRVDLVYHSDTLFSAVTHAMRLLGRLEYWLEVTARRGASGEGAPLVRFTSMFPFFGDTLYVPPPRHIWPPAPSVRVHYGGARFIPVSLVESIFAGKPLQDDRWAVDGTSACLVPAGKSGPFRIGVRSSAAVDRLSGASQPHRTACLEFVPKAGLWFGIAFADAISRDQWTDPLKAAIRLLADSGFGGERSRGWGRTHAPEFRDGPLARLIYRGTPAAEFLHWNLSLLSPAESDRVEWDRGSYSTSVRGGRIESPAASGAAKKLLTMIEEGSVLSATVLEGNAPDVAPDGFAHPVYHAGWAFTIPVPSEVPKQIEAIEAPVAEEPVIEEPAVEEAALEAPVADAAEAPLLAAEEEAAEELSPPDDVEEAPSEISHLNDDDFAGTGIPDEPLETEIPTSEEDLERLEETPADGPQDPVEPPMDDPGPMEPPFREPDDLTPIEPDPSKPEEPVE